MNMVLTHITGGKLTMKFNPDGALSSARLEGRDVTSELRVVRNSDCMDLLNLFGFRSEHPSGLVEKMLVIHKQLEEHGYGLLRVDEEVDNKLLVWACKLKDTRNILKVAHAIFRYDLVENRLTEVVRMNKGVVDYWKQKTRCVACSPSEKSSK